MSSKTESFEWAKIPPEYDRRFIFKVVASQATETDHTKDMTLPPDQRKIRVYSNEERKIAARSLALRHIDINHDFKRIIPDATVLDAQFVEPNKIECICYIPNEEIIKQIRAGFYNGVSIEEMNREDIPIGDNKLDIRGITYYGLALVEPPFKAGDPLTSINPMFEGFLILESKFEFLIKAEPFADYIDFADCVSKNQDKENPDAYCGTIKAQTEGKTLEEAKLIVSKIPFTLKKIEAAVVDPAKVADPAKVVEKKPEERIKELEDTVTRLQKTIADNGKTLIEEKEKTKKETKVELIKKIEEVIPSVLVQRQSAYPVNRLVTDLKRKLRECEK